MSANNEIVIQKEMYDWVVREQDVDEGNGKEVGRADNLESAVDMANKYMENREVEYGLRVIR